jgi:P27 family predicted phage terminase small subunit
MAGRKGAGGRKGRSGRRPLPLEVKEARGTVKKSRERAAAAQAPAIRFPQARLEAPDWLDDEGRNEWNRIVAELDQVRVLTNPDLVALANYCANVALLIKATRAYQKDGLMRTKTRVHPLIKVAHEARAQCLRFAIEFGLTPAARTRVAAGGAPPAPPAGPAEKPVDEAEDFLFHPPKLVVSNPKE